MDRGESSYRRYLCGEESAFEEIVKDYRDPLTFFICGIVRDYHLAEDIAIDCFAELAVKKHFNGKASLKTYLFTLGRSRAIDALRRQKRHVPLPLSEAEAYIADSTDVAEEYLQDEEKAKLHHAIAALPEKQRTAIHLFYFEDLSYEETARVMKMSKKQVDNLLYRAKAELRSALTGEQEKMEK